MIFYDVFGGLLESELEFPELRSTLPGTPDWILRATAASAVPVYAEVLGYDDVDVGVRVRALRTPAGYRLEFDDTGVFDISADGREIRWYRPPDGNERVARLDVCGRVLAVALHAGGWLSLHGSAVSLGGKAVGFLGSKRSGKSTLAVALANAGAQFMSDDMLPVAPIPTPIARPGIKSIRMFADSAACLGISGEHSVDFGDAKPTFHEAAIAHRRDSPAALDSIYLLMPPPLGSPYAAARRTHVAGLDAALGVLRHTKVGALLGRREAAALLTRTVALIDQVPVYELEIARDFARLPEVVRQILSWHGHAPAVRDVVSSVFV